MDRYGKVITALPKVTLALLRKQDAALQQEVFQLCSELGGIYVKFLQLLVSSTDFFNLLDPLLRSTVFSEVPPSPLNHQEVLQSELSTAELKSFAWIASKPFAAGSFANVYRARLTTGEEVIVKIKRPGLEKQLKKDIRILRFIVLLASLTPAAAEINLRQIAAEYETGIKAETNYRQETRNAEAFYEAYRLHPTIIIPKTYTFLCTRNVIVQEFIDGITLSEIVMNKDQAQATVFKRLGSDFNKQLYALGVDTLQRVFSGTHIHGDPHPGNIVLLPHNKVGFIDFGILAKPSKDPNGYYNYMHEQTLINHGTLRPGKFGLAMLRVYSPRLFHSLNYIDIRTPERHILNHFEKALDQRFYYHNKNAESILHDMQQGHTSEKFMHALNPHRQLPLPIQIDGVTSYRACHVIWTTIIKFDLYRELIPTIYDEAVKRARLRNNSVHYRGAPHNYEEAMEILLEWVEHVRESDPFFFASIQSIIPGF